MGYLDAAFQLGGSALWLAAGFALGRYCYRRRKDPATKGGEGVIEAFGVFALISAVPAMVLFGGMPQEDYYLGAFWLMSVISMILGFALNR